MQIYGKYRSELKVYKKYIDDAFIVWVGSEKALKEFLG